MGLEKSGRRGLVGEKWETEGKCRGGVKHKAVHMSWWSAKASERRLPFEEGFEGREGVLLEGKGIKTSSGTGEGMYKGTVAHM